MESLFRLKPGVTSEAANGELRALTRRLGKENPSTNGEWNARAVPLAACLQPARRAAALDPLSGLRAD